MGNSSSRDGTSSSPKPHRSLSVRPELNLALLDGISTDVSQLGLGHWLIIANCIRQPCNPVATHHNIANELLPQAASVGESSSEIEISICHDLSP